MNVSRLQLCLGCLTASIQELLMLRKPEQIGGQFMYRMIPFESR